MATAREVWKDGPVLSPANPEKHEIRTWGTGLESATSALVNGITPQSIKAERTDLYAVAGDFDEGDIGWVLLDPIESRRGIYKMVSGAFVRQSDLPGDVAAAHADEAADSAEDAADSKASASVSASTAAGSANSAAARANEAEGYRDDAELWALNSRATADATGPVRFFDTKALAVAALAGLPADQSVEVSIDETLGGARVRYVKESSVLVYKFVVQGEGATVPISYFGTADFEDGLDLLLASTRHQISLPAGTMPAYSRELDDGDHFVIDLNVFTELLLDGAAPVLNFYSLPKWIEGVSSVTRSDSVNLAEAGNTASNNSTDVLHLSGARTVKRGQILKIVSDDDIDGGKNVSGSLHVRRGEIVVVALDSSSTSVTLTSRLKDTYTTNARVFALKDARVDIINGRGDFDDALTELNAQPIIKLEGLSRCHLSGLTTPRALGIGVQLVGCYGTRISVIEGANHHNDPSQNNFGYGVDVVACEDTIISNISGSNLRHLVTTNSYGIAADQTGSNMHRYGRTRALVVSGGAVMGGSNAGFDTHDEVDGAVFNGVSVMNSYAGANSGGGGIQMRGRNVRCEAAIIDGCQTGVAMRTIEGGYFQGTVRNARKWALSFSPGDSSVDQNCEGTVSDSLLEVVDCLTPNVLSISCAAGKTAKLKIQDTTIKVSGDGSLVGQIFELDDAGIELSLDNVTIDLTGATGLAALYIFSVANDSVKVRGNLKIIGGTAVLTNLLKLTGAGSARTSDIELDITVDGNNTFNQGSSAFPFGVNPTVFTKAKVKGEIRYSTSSVRRSRYTSVTPTAGSSVLVGGHLDDNVIVALTPAGDCIGFSGALDMDRTNVRPGQRITLFNNSDFIVQLQGNAYLTMGPRASATFLVTDASTPLLFLVSKSGQQGIITQAASYTCGSRDNGAQMALNNAANTQSLILPAGATIDTEIDFYQAGAGYFTFAAASGATIRSAGGALKTGGQYTRCRAKCIGNVGGSAAEWLLTGTLAV